MTSYKIHTNYEIDKYIKISNYSPTQKKDTILSKEYSLNQQFFDPSKRSPPNDFMLKLQMRMSIYDSVNQFSK